LVEGRELRELERLLGLEGGTASKNEALSYLERLLTKPAHASQPSQARSLNFSSLASSSLAPPSPSPQAQQSSGGAWERIELEPGLELHFQNNYQPPKDTKGLRRLAQSIMRLIKTRGQR
jgi:hypothetical protein